MSSKELCKWVERQAEIHGPGYKLPSGPVLARQFGLSPRRVHHYLKEYMRAGLLERTPRKGTFVAGVPEAIPQSLPIDLSSSENMAQVLRDAIFHGEFRTGTPLPSLKQLAIQFKVSYNTAVRACRSLVTSGLIVKTGKTFWVGRVAEMVRPPRAREVIFLNYKSDDFSGLYHTDPLALAYVKMEKELLEYGYLPRYESTDALPGMVEQWNAGQKCPDALVFCATQADQFVTLEPALHAAYRGLTARGPRILADWRLGKYVPAIPEVQVQVWGSITTTAAQVLARYLLAKQFGAAVFFLHEEGTVWHFPAWYLSLFMVYWEMQEMDPGFELRYILKPADTTCKHLRWVQESLIPERTTAYRRRKTEAFDQTSLERLRGDTLITADFAREYEKQRGVPVWIFDRDADAGIACAWARKQGIKVPEQLSVIGLENDPKFYHLGLTYCGPDWDAIGYQMAHAVIGDFPVAKTGKGFIKAKAAVIEKLTTR